MYIPSSNRKPEWQDFTLILPTVSVGNVGQLAADLIISTLRMELVGYVLHPCLLPVVGNNPYADEDSSSYKMSTGCEVFENSATKIIVIQQRAPIIKGRRKEYAAWLSDWIKENHFHQVVILTSTFAQDRLDHQMTGSPFRILLSPKMEEKMGEFFQTKMEWQKLEPRCSLPESTHALGAEAARGLSESKGLHLPGSGITKLVYEGCQDLPMLVLLMFVSEGDNAQDALAVAAQLNRWLDLLAHKMKYNILIHALEPLRAGMPSIDVQMVFLQNVKEKPQQNGSCVGNIADWKIPMSWRLVFGSTYDQKLFQ